MKAFVCILNKAVASQELQFLFKDDYVSIRNKSSTYTFRISTTKSMALILGTEEHDADSPIFLPPQKNITFANEVNLNLNIPKMLSFKLSFESCEGTRTNWLTEHQNIIFLSDREILGLILVDGDKKYKHPPGTFNYVTASITNIFDDAFCINGNTIHVSVLMNKIN